MPTGYAEFDLPLEELERYRPERREPDDFDAFWAWTLEATRAHPLDLELAPVAHGLTALEAFDVTFRGFGGDPIRGWLVRDPDAPLPQPCVVQCNGYGAGRGDVLEHLAWASAGWAHLVVDPRGQGALWTHGETPDPHAAEPHVPGFATKGIQSPETYYYRRYLADGVRAVEAATAIPGVDPARIAVVGTSQGGGGALAVGALSERVAAVVAHIPYGLHFPRAIRLTDEEPYAEIGAYLRIRRDEVEQVERTLSYFDGVNFAVRGRVPALFTAALMDRICPPSTIFAACNHYGGAREMRVWPFEGHDGGIAQLRAGMAFAARVLA